MSKTENNGIEVREGLESCFISPNVPDSNLEPANVVDVIAGAGLNISRALKALGNGSASTNMGAIEALGKVFKEDIAPALNNIADAIREHG